MSSIAHQMLAAEFSSLLKPIRAHFQLIVFVRQPAFSAESGRSVCMIAVLALTDVILLADAVNNILLQFDRAWEMLLLDTITS